MAIITQNGSLTVTYEIIDGSIREDVDEVRLSMKCAWADRHDLRDQLMGQSVAAGSDIVVTNGHRYPDDPRLRATNVSISPFGTHTGQTAGAGDTLRLVYDHALLEVRYTLAEWDTDRDTDKPLPILLTEELGVATEFKTTSWKKLWWRYPDDATWTTGNRVGEDAAPGVLRSMMTWRVTIHKLAIIPSAVKDLPGLTNCAAVTAITTGFVYQPETLLYLGPTEMVRDFTVTGALAWRLGLEFIHKDLGADGDDRRGWNHFDQPGQALPQRIYLGDPTEEAATIYKPYVPADLTPLLVFEPSA